MNTYRKESKPPTPDNFLDVARLLADVVERGAEALEATAASDPTENVSS